MISIAVLCIILLLIPAMVGELLRGVSKSAGELPFRWISGQILLWAGFQLICVPMILLEQNFSQLQRAFQLYTVLLLGVSFLVVLRRIWKRKRSGSSAACREASRPKSMQLPAPRPRSWYILWGIALLLLLFQLLMIGFLAYEEGDDAFYVALSTITMDSDTMYRKLPYTGSATGLDARHGLAPFPMWIAYLAKTAGIPAATAAHIAAPIILVLIAYALYYLLGKKLLAERLQQLPFFFILAELMVLFGGYSVYSAENFLLVRTSQGKAVIANIILPFLLLLLLLLLEKLEKAEKIGFSHWLLLSMTMISGCLCSTLGSLLTCMLMGIVGICGAVCYRKWKLLLPMAICCVPPACYALLYFTIRA